MRCLRVFADQVQVGTLYEGDDLWRFAYTEAWASAPDGSPHAYDLAPGLPRSRREHLDGGTHRPVQWFFDNLLPEEQLREAISMEAGIKGDDAFALLQYLGAESAGALTLLPPGDAPSAAGQLRALNEADLSRRIRALPRQTLTAQAPKRMSLAGAQHKLLVVCHHETLYEPVGATPSTHILKPAHPDTERWPASVINEYLTMRLARAVGLDVPAVQIRYVPEPVFIVERFDRRVSHAGTAADGTPLLQVQRRHIIDACQLLDRARTFKHTGASLDALREVVRRTTNRAATRIALFRWLAFNLLVGNDDCHLKNLSFHVGPDGVTLAPAYDLLATGVYHTRALADERARWPDLPLAIALPGAGRFGEATRAALLEAALALGVPRHTAERILTGILRKIGPALHHERQAMAERHAHLTATARRAAAGEARLARTLESVVLRDMQERLAG